MPDRSVLEPTARRDLHVFYVLDTSGSMVGTPIQILNQAMQETIRALEKVAKKNGDAQLKLSVLEFNTTVKWMHQAGPQRVEDFAWFDLTAGGLTQIGAALDELNSKLSRREFMKSEGGTLLPIIIFMTDGHPTDDYHKSLDVIKQNKLFRRASKIGFAVGEHADAEMIAHLTGDSEAVIRTNNLALFAKLLQFVSVTSSVIASTSQISGGPTSNGRTALKRALEETGVDANEINPGFVYYDAETTLLDEQAANDTTDIIWEDSDDDEW